MELIYERHSHVDSSFPIIYHYDTVTIHDRHFMMHWHENIELLYFKKGKVRIIGGAQVIEAGEGELAIINSGSLHNIQAATSECQYYCLIIDKNLCEDFDIPISEIQLEAVITNPETLTLFDRIIQEMKEKQPFYKSMVKADAIQLLAYLCRCHTIDQAQPFDKGYSNKVQMVKESILYIKGHFRENITIDEICNEIGFSKHYFCRVFKSITGKTTVDYINILRCDYARRLLQGGEYNVSQVALMCGFHNLSYFTKTYKKHMGYLPSEEL